MKTMREMIENGYTVYIEGMWGDIFLTTESLGVVDIECYEEDAEFVSIDEEKKMVCYEEPNYEDYYD